MIRITDIAEDPGPVSDTLTLPFELRQKARLQAKTDSGIEVGLFLNRGIVLRGGQVLVTEEGQFIAVVSALEAVSTASSPNAHLLARACYHLGNRHVPLEIQSAFVRYLSDHVLDEMLVKLGLTVSSEQAAFEPESGAYSHGHGHHE